MNQSTTNIQTKIKKAPDIAIVLGSGLSELHEILENAVEINYNDIPGFLKTTVKGHKGKIYSGSYLGKSIMMLSGRFHYYEGYTAKQITSYIDVLYELGVKQLILTNAAGGINRDFVPGDLMVISDHINFANVNPLIGENNDAIGPRFFDMSDAYNSDMRQTIHDAANTCGIPQTI